MAYFGRHPAFETSKEKQYKAFEADISAFIAKQSQRRAHESVNPPRIIYAIESCHA